MTAEGRFDGRKAKKAAQEGGEKALFLAAGFAREQANRTVPMEEGTLQRSGGIEVDARKGQAAIYYDTHYAVTQHEDTTMSHDAGRRAKWLELTLAEQASRIKDLLARGMGGAFR